MLTALAETMNDARKSARWLLAAL